MNKKMLGVILILSVFLVAGIVSARGFDEFGYNYQANIFNGRYCDFDKVIGGDFCDVSLQMKWNDAWLNEDKVRHEGFDSYIGSGAWLTNHQRGINDDGSLWTYFVKIVAKPHGEYLCPNGGEIWGDFCIIQEINSGDGDKILYDLPGFGVY